MATRSAIRIAPGIYWTGTERRVGGLSCNAYLLVDGRQGVLINPGSPLLFQEIFHRISSLLEIEKLAYIVLLHPGPDEAGAIPYFKKAGFRGQIVSHSDTASAALHYRISSSLFLVDRYDFRLSLKSGRILDFIPAPHLPSPGALMLYDPLTETLFSGELFGAFSKRRSLYAGESYSEEMKPYHRHFFPGDENLRLVLEELQNKNIAMICPHHGAILSGDIPQHIQSLLESDAAASPETGLQETQDQRGYGEYLDMVSMKLNSVFSPEEITECCAGTDWEPEPGTGRLQNISGSDNRGWNAFFDRIYAYGGNKWLALLEPLVLQIEEEHGIPRPGIYLSRLAGEKRKNLQLQEELKRLEQSNESLKSNLALTQEAMIRDQMTGLYNEDFLVRYLLNIFNEVKWQDLYALFIQVDTMRQLNQAMGEQKGDEIISSVGSLLLQEQQADDYLFRIGGPVFVMISPKSSPGEIRERAEAMRNRIEDDSGFIHQITISLGLVPVNFSEMKDLPAPAAMEHIFTTGRMLLGTAARKGGNRVESELSGLERRAVEGRVVIIEYDGFHAQLIGDSLETLSIDYRICLNGPEALTTIQEFHPDVIVSEVFLFETDVFNLKEELQENTRTKDIPFILVSHQKNDFTVARAMSLGILHYLRKPYMLPELLGIIDTYIQKALTHAY